MRLIICRLDGLDGLTYFQECIKVQQLISEGYVIGHDAVNFTWYIDFETETDAAMFRLTHTIRFS